MIKQNKGNLLENVTEGFIVHGCNAQGVMGAGFAKELVKMYPKAFCNYRRSYERMLSATGDPNDMLGSISFYRVEKKNLVIINAITQKNIGRGQRQVNYIALGRAFHRLNKFIQGEVFGPDIPKIVHFPKIGSGLGGGDWEIISRSIDHMLEDNIEKNLWVL